MEKFIFKKNNFHKLSNYLNKLIENKSINPSENNFQFEKHHLEQTLFYFQQLINYLIKTNSLQYLLLAKIYEIIANIYYKQSNFNQSLEYYQQSLYYYEKSHPNLML